MSGTHADLGLLTNYDEKTKFNSDRVRVIPGEFGVGGRGLQGHHRGHQVFGGVLRSIGLRLLQ